MKREIRRCIAAGAFVLAGVCGVSSQNGGARAGGAVVAEVAQTAIVSRQDLTIDPPPGKPTRFRFLPSGQWTSFDRPLVLSACDKEERYYLVEMGESGGAIEQRGYLIDKKAPNPPSANPPSGLYRLAVLPRLSAEPGSRIFWRQIGPSIPDEGFRPYDPSSQAAVSPPASDSLRYSILAYAEDVAGNRSLPAVFAYRLAEAGPDFETPPSTVFSVPLSVSADLPSPSIEVLNGRALLGFQALAGQQALVAVNPPVPPSRFEDFSRVEALDGRAIFAIECPYSWKGKLRVYFGSYGAGRAIYNPEPISLELANLPNEDPPLPRPSPPGIVADDLGRGSYLVFPSYAESIFFATDDSDFRRYEAPVALGTGKRPKTLRWFGKDGRERRSETSTVTLESASIPQEIILDGAADGDEIGQDVKLTSPRPASIRYEISLDRTIPPEPGFFSPLLGEGLSLSCPSGEERHTAIRYRVFSGPERGAVAGETRLLRFKIDKKPPNPPRPEYDPRNFSERSIWVPLISDEEKAEIYASVSAGNGAAAFQRMTSPILLRGNRTEPVQYQIRAYSVDRAGNRSQEMAVLGLTVDASAIHISSKGSDAGDGSCDSPYGTLEAALRDERKEARIVSGRDLVLPATRIRKGFRFLPDGPWLDFDRPLVLGAAIGEERVYSLETRDESDRLKRREFRIDKRPPAPPEVSPVPGDYPVEIVPYLHDRDDARIIWSLTGYSPNDGFNDFAPDSRPRLRLSETLAKVYHLAAYAEDGAGNRSTLGAFVYHLSSTEIQAEKTSGLSQFPAIAPAELPALDIRMRPGRTRIVKELQSGERLLLAVNPPSPPSRVEDFIIVEASSTGAGATGETVFDIDGPYGWSGELLVYWGILKANSALFNPQPHLLRLADLPLAVLPPVRPDAPVLAADSAGRGASLFFPSYDGTVFFSLDGAQPLPYAAPIFLKPGATKLRVSWYGEDRDGRRSKSGDLEVTAPRRIPDVLLKGVSEGELLGREVSLVPAMENAPGLSAAIRYELRLDGSTPPEPSAASPLVGNTLPLLCPQGEERSVVLRYRAFADSDPAAAGGESRTLRFTMDRKAPAPPRVVAPLPVYADKPCSLAFTADEPSAAIYVSVSTTEKESPYIRYGTALDFPGSAAGPVSYSIRSYAVDKAGNRSEETPAILAVVDTNTIYASDDAADSGDGSPVKPFGTIEAALAASIRTGRSNIHLRGSFEIRSTLSLVRTLGLFGGFAGDWSRDPSSPAALRLAVRGNSSAISVKGAALSLRGLAISAVSEGATPLILVDKGNLSLEDVAFSTKGEGDIVMIRSTSSRALLERSTLSAERGMSCTALNAEDSTLILRNSIISALQGLHIFNAIDQRGGSLEIQSSLLESSADLALRLLTLRDASFLMDRSLARAEGGSGNLRLGSFRNVKGEVRSSKFLVSWKGDGSLFEIESSGPSFRHDTVLAQTSKGSLRFFDVTGTLPEVWNCILSCASGGGELLRSARAPLPGSFVADCLWGFDRFVAGAVEIRSLSALDALNAGSSLYSSRRHISEPPARSFAVSGKGQVALGAGSACIDAALALNGVYAQDYSGRKRPSEYGKGLPDIGADEYRD